MLAPPMFSTPQMKRLSQYFFRGLMTILPLGLTVYVLYMFISWMDALAMSVISPIIGDFYLRAWALCWAWGPSWAWVS